MKIKITIILVLTTVLIPFSGYCQDVNYLFFDDFSGNAWEKWETRMQKNESFEFRPSRREDTTITFEKHSLKCRNFALEYDLYVLSETAIDPSRNFSLKYKFDFKNNSAGMELIWGSYSSIKKNALLIRRIKNTFYYKVYRKEPDETVFINWSKFECGNLQDDWDTELIKVRNTMELRVNGQFVCQFPFKLLMGNKIGFMLEAPQSVEFKQISAKYLPYVTQIKFKPNKKNNKPKDYFKIYYPTINAQNHAETFIRHPMMIGQLSDEVSQLFINDKEIITDEKNYFLRKLILNEGKDEVQFLIILKDGNIIEKKLEINRKYKNRKKPKPKYSLSYSEKKHDFSNLKKIKNKVILPFKNRIIYQLPEMNHRALVYDYNGKLIAERHKNSYINQVELRYWHRYSLIENELIDDTTSVMYSPYLITPYRSPFSNKLWYSKYTNGKNTYILGADYDGYYLFDFQYCDLKSKKHTYHWLDKKNAVFEISTDFNIAFQGINKIDTSEVEIFDKNGAFVSSFFTNAKLEWLSPKGNVCVMMSSTPVYFNQDENYKCLHIYDKEGNEKLRKGNYKDTRNTYKLITNNKLLVVNSNDICCIDIKRGRLLWEINKGYQTTSGRICYSDLTKEIYILNYNPLISSYVFTVIEPKTGQELYFGILPFDIGFSWYENEILFERAKHKLVYRNESASYYIQIKENKSLK